MGRTWVILGADDAEPILGATALESAGASQTPKRKGLGGSQRRH